jgi:hypothetical protein
MRAPLTMNVEEGFQANLLRGTLPDHVDVLLDDVGYLVRVEGLTLLEVEELVAYLRGTRGAA